MVLSEVQVLAVGVDTLIINVKRVVHPKETNTDDEGLEREQEGVPEHLSSLLACWQDGAKNAGEPFETAWKHEKKTLMMHPMGTRTHQYLLKNGLVDLLFCPLLKNGALARVRFSSEYLWRYGVDRALIETHAFLWSLFQEEVTVQPAEIHLCTDVANLKIPNHNYERVFVSRSTKWRPIKTSELDRSIYRHHELETLQFSGHSNPISITIYNKPAEIEYQSQEKRWFYDIWKVRGWDGESPVWRIECRIKREALHEMDLEDTYEVIEQVPSLWAYCVGLPGETSGWLRMVKPNTRDSNRRRWGTTDAWVSVQKAFTEHWRESKDITALQRDRKRAVNLDRAEKAIAGYTATYAAWLQEEVEPTDDVSVVLQRLYDKMVTIWEKKGTDFHALRLKKQLEYHI